MGSRVERGNGFVASSTMVGRAAGVTGLATQLKGGAERAHVGGGRRIAPIRNAAHDGPNDKCDAGVTPVVTAGVGVTVDVTLGVVGVTPDMTPDDDVSGHIPLPLRTRGIRDVCGDARSSAFTGDVTQGHGVGEGRPQRVT